MNTRLGQNNWIVNKVKPRFCGVSFCPRQRARVFQHLGQGLKGSFWCGLFLILTSNAYADIIDDIIPYIIQAESSGNPQAVSKTGAIGLMQISEIVFDEYQEWAEIRRPTDAILLSTWTFDNMFNPYSNKEVGEWYLRRLKNHYLKDNYTIERLLAAYNMGYSRLKKLNYKWWRIKETRNYVKKVMRLYKKGAE